jgi:large subunit ribosomal protein L4
MAQVDVINQKGEKIDTIELDDKVFAAEVKDHLIQRAVVWQLAKRRQGSASTKTRGQVRGGGTKPWRQKGTGRARAGTNSSPLWTGGGTIFGPHPRSYAFSLPKKVRKAALRSVLSSKLSENKLTVVDNIELEDMGLDGSKVLFVTPQKDEALHRSSRNVYRVQVLPFEGLNVYDLLRYDKLVLFAETISKIHERLG